MATNMGRKLAGFIVIVTVLGGVLWIVFRNNGDSLKNNCDIKNMEDVKADKGKSLPVLTNPRVVIVKSTHRLLIYDGDTKVKTYRVGFGKRQGDKTREGDKRTPEGKFYICTKNPNSRFTLSLGLSYPNIEDAGRGLRDGLIRRSQHDTIVAAIRARRQPPWNTTLGGEIMIHGCGGGSDWTLGCVAMDDDDIRELFKALPLRTPVEIRP